MGYRTFERNDKYQARKGLEGPFNYPNGQVLYYDPKEGKYYDPTTDFYVEHDDVLDLMATVFTTLSK
jgi:hypothetical protein